MNSNEYQELTGRTESIIDGDDPKPPFIRHPHPGYVGIPTSLVRLLHHIIGHATEAGEMLDQLKRHMYYGKPLDRTNLIEESGDSDWYNARLLAALGITKEDSQTRNIAKLQARYPQKFTSDDALNRDLDKERAALEASEKLVKEHGWPSGNKSPTTVEDWEQASEAADFPKPVDNPVVKISNPTFRYAPGGVGSAVVDVLRQTFGPQPAAQVQEECNELAKFFLQISAQIQQTRIERESAALEDTIGGRVIPPKREKCTYCPGIAGPNGLCADCAKEFADKRAGRPQSPGQQRATSIDRQSIHAVARRNEATHRLYTRDDPDAPNSIKDGNGDIVLGLCRLCGAGEAELAEMSCDARRRSKVIQS